MDEIDFSLAMQSVIDENKNTSTEDLIMKVTASRFEYHTWAVAGFEKILEKRNLAFNIYTEDFFKKKFTEKFSRYYPGWCTDITEMLSKLIENGWNLSIPITAKDYHGSFECYITTENKTLEEIVEKYIDIINTKCQKCGKSVVESVNELGICDRCYSEFIKNYH